MEQLITTTHSAPREPWNKGKLVGQKAPLRLRAFVACARNDRLIAVDLTTGKVLAQFPAAKDPDVLACDPLRELLCVAGESGDVSEFNVANSTVIKSGESFLAPNAHVVAVNPTTHEIYFPLMNVNGKLRVMRGEKQ